jgi:hypothetical protein
MNERSGYGRPPKKNQFRKGESGNPKGRPPKSKDDVQSVLLMKDIKDACDRRIVVHEDGVSKRVSLRQFLFSKLTHRAVSTGDVKALDQLLRWVEKADRAALEGRAGEPMVIRIIGGLPD